MALDPCNKIPAFGRVCALIGICCFLNLAVWSLLSAQHGGNAINGTTEEGRYYFPEHGAKTEVPEHVWRFSRAYTEVTMGLVGIGALALCIFGAYANEARQKIVEPLRPANGG